MEENSLAIPFDINDITGNIFNRIYKKVRTGIKLFIVRFMDIIFSLIGLIFLLPLTFIVYINNLKNGDRGSVFFVDERIGKDGKIFKMYKFRTMCENAEEKLTKILEENEDLREEYSKYKKLANDPRLTKFGKKLRLTALDELPQIINILKGDMTLVGNRPYAPEEIPDMGHYYNYIIQRKPGLTGIYQIAGKKRVTFAERLDLDYKYHYNKRFWTDLKILSITLFVTLKRKNTYKLKDLTYVTVKDAIYYLNKLANLFVKRIIDIVGALVGIVILVPLTLVVAILNAVNGDGGPLFYCHTRIGKNGKHFKMYKFRSMVVDADERLAKMLAEDEEVRKEFEATRKLKNDPRITKIGNFLRKTSLDEFPQFINVLKGEMSLVGPRAVIDGEIELFGDKKDLVLSVKPGITGYWAAHGRSDTSYEERVEMESYYAENMSVVLDIQLLFRTVVSVLKEEGAV